MTPSPTDDPTTDESTADAAWLAVRYVLGELPAPEAAAFETRLSIDQPAREAVASAVRLIDTLAVSRAPDAAAPRRTAPRARRFIAVAALAAAVLVAVVVNVPRDADPTRPVAATDADPARLAAVWSATDAWSGIEPVAEDDDPAAPRDPLLPPDWLIAAVESAAGPTVDGAAEPAYIPGN